MIFSTFALSIFDRILTAEFSTDFLKKYYYVVKLPNTPKKEDFKTTFRCIFQKKKKKKSWGNSRRKKNTAGILFLDTFSISKTRSKSLWCSRKSRNTRFLFIMQEFMREFRAFKQNFEKWKYSPNLEVNFECDSRKVISSHPGKKHPNIFKFLNFLHNVLQGMFCRIPQPI